LPIIPTIIEPLKQLTIIRFGKLLNQIIFRKGYFNAQLSNASGNVGDGFQAIAEDCVSERIFW
jgi:hypothetical protein